MTTPTPYVHDGGTLGDARQITAEAAAALSRRGFTVPGYDVRVIAPGSACDLLWACADLNHRTGRGTVRWSREAVGAAVRITDPQLIERHTQTSVGAGATKPSGASRKLGSRTATKNAGRRGPAWDARLKASGPHRGAHSTAPTRMPTCIAWNTATHELLHLATDRRVVGRLTDGTARAAFTDWSDAQYDLNHRRIWRLAGVYAAQARRNGRCVVSESWRAGEPEYTTHEVIRRESWRVAEEALRGGGG